MNTYYKLYYNNNITHIMAFQGRYSFNRRYVIFCKINVSIFYPILLSSSDIQCPSLSPKTKKADFLENGAQNENLSKSFWKKNVFPPFYPKFRRLISFICLWIRISYQLKYVIPPKLNFGTEMQISYMFLRQNVRKSHFFIKIGQMLLWYIVSFHKIAI